MDLLLLSKAFQFNSHRAELSCEGTQLADFQLYPFDWKPREDFLADLMTKFLQQAKALLDAKRLDASEDRSIVHGFTQIT